ncbi:hypothetical protein EV127DRAFT_196577 [Xylaria flabelliformis]|nr:hypothetical protein EV127DRAFT_196577 [Xylaria flabelliformis]
MPLAPPTDGSFDTFQQGFDAWQAHALAEGYVIKKSNSSDKREGQYTRHIIRCRAGPLTKAPRATIRKTSTASQGCRFEASAKLYNGADAWTFQVKHPYHTHLPSFTTPTHRKQQMTPEVISMIVNGLDNSMPRRLIYRTIKSSNPDLVLTPNDISNFISRRLRKDAAIRLSNQMHVPLPTQEEEAGADSSS